MYDLEYVRLVNTKWPHIVTSLEWWWLYWGIIPISRMIATFFRLVNYVKFSQIVHPIYWTYWYTRVGMLKVCVYIYIIIYKYNRTELTKFMCRMWLGWFIIWGICVTLCVSLNQIPSAELQFLVFIFDDWTVALHIFMSQTWEHGQFDSGTPTSSMTSAFASTWLPGAEGTGRTEGNRTFWVPVPGSHDQWL